MAFYVSEYYAKELLKDIFDNAAEREFTTELALATSVDYTTDTFTEVSGAGYQRVSIGTGEGHGDFYWHNNYDGTPRYLENAKSVEFPEASGNWGNVMALVLCGDLGGAGAEMIAVMPLSGPVSIVAGQQPVFAAHDIQVNYDQNFMTDVCPKNLLLWLFKGGAPNFVEIIGQTKIGFAVTPSYTEVPSGRGYSRQPISNYTFNGRALTNTQAIDFGAITTSWGTIGYAGIYPKDSDGTNLWYCFPTSFAATQVGRHVIIPAGALSISFGGL